MASSSSPPFTSSVSRANDFGKQAGLLSQDGARGTDTVVTECLAASYKEVLGHLCTLTVVDSYPGEYENVKARHS